jgi:TonB family protein
MINYLIELAIVHIVLFFGYCLFLRKERQYARMRSYLIASTILALAIPLLKFPKLFSFSQAPSVIVPMEAMYMDAVSIAPAAAESPGAYELLIWAYITVSSFFLVKFLSDIVCLFRLERRSRRETVNGITIRRVGNIKGSFTFFNWIFVSNEIDPQHQNNEMILKHEQAHASLGHTYDLIFLELFKAWFWWLPTAWIVLKETKELHEYQADAIAIKTCDIDTYSSVLINSTLKINGLKPTNSFNDGLILKRLKAMKQQAKNVSPWKLAALSILCATLFIVLACGEEKSMDVNVIEADPEFEGGSEAFYNYIRQEIRYPLQARETGVEGNVEVEFVIDKDGSISEVEAITGIGAGCDEEAVRVVKSVPRFKAATQNGKPVRVRMVIPIVFQLKLGKTNSDKSKQGMVIIGKIQSKTKKLKVDTHYVNGEWTGTVYDEELNSLPGANIVVPGTTTGTISSEDGTFKLKAEEANGIVVTFIGYEPVGVVPNLVGPGKNWQEILNHPKFRQHTWPGS